MKYCNDKEKAQVLIIVAATFAIVIYISVRIGSIAEALIDDITYDAKVRHVLRQCDECIERAQKQQEANNKTEKGSDDAKESHQQNREGIREKGKDA